MENLDYEEVQQKIPYTYSISGWRDQLLKYNDEEFEYDAIGNPTKYRNKSLEWSYGRLLSNYDNKIQFVYNLNGIRTAKISDFTTRFFLNGNKIIEQVDSKNSIKFYYGAEGLTGFHLTSKDNKNDNIIDSDFFYKKNAQNDIIGIYNSEGKEIAKYYYDAWGNQKIKYLVETDSNTIEYVDIGEDFDYNDISNINRFIAYKNPFRYRSYYWDYETGLYYLNSRYYDPELGRFINADKLDNIDTENLNGFNLYMYCADNPVMFTDENGDAWWKRLITALVVIVAVVAVVAITVATAGAAATAVAAGIGALAGAASYTTSYVVNGLNTGNWNWSWSEFLGNTLGGMINGMLFFTGLNSFVSGVISGGSTSLITSALDYVIYGKELNTKEVIVNLLYSSLFEGISSSIISKYFKIPGMTKGRGSWIQIRGQLLKKLKNKTISRISLKSIFKLFSLEFITGLPSSLARSF